MKTLSLGYSPCPNDTFIFYGLIHDKIPCSNITFKEQLEDVETLNRLALDGVLDLTKISYHAFGHLRDQYALLRSGGALGRGCGPLVIAPQQVTMEQLRGKKIAIPGQLTTANLLLQLYGEGYEDLLILPFEQVMPAIQDGQADAGVIIHESRFTYQQYGLNRFWTWGNGGAGFRLPIPLGGILAKRSLGTETINRIDTALQQSVRYAYAHPQEPGDYIRQHAQELEEEVVRSHIDLYVNDFSIDLGNEGIQAVTTLFQELKSAGLFRHPGSPCLQNKRT